MVILDDVRSNMELALTALEEQTGDAQWSAEHERDANGKSEDVVADEQSTSANRLATRPANNAYEDTLHETTLFCSAESSLGRYLTAFVFNPRNADVAACPLYLLEIFPPFSR